MNHVFLIAAHNNVEYLSRLVGWLDTPCHGFIIHIDKKNESLLESEDMKRLKVKKNVYVFSAYAVNWGGFAQVQMTIAMLEKAFEMFPTFDWVHLISGSHIPLKSNEAFDSIYDQSAYKGFMGQATVNGKPPVQTIEKRMCIYHFNDIHDRRRHDIQGGYFVWLKAWKRCY